MMHVVKSIRCRMSLFMLLLVSVFVVTGMSDSLEVDAVSTLIEKKTENMFIWESDIAVCNILAPGVFEVDEAKPSFGIATVGSVLLALSLRRRLARKS